MFEKIKVWSAICLGLTNQNYLATNRQQNYARHETAKNSATAVLKAGVITLFFVLSMSHESANATPCSCWDSGTSVRLGASCWAAWDTGNFSPDLTDAQTLSGAIEAAIGGLGATTVGVVAAVVATDPAAATTLATMAYAVMGVALGYIMYTGIEAMEACRKVCQATNTAYNLNKSVWWYADPTALEACHATRPELVNKY